MLWKLTTKHPTRNDRSAHRTTSAGPGKNREFAVAGTSIAVTIIAVVLVGVVGTARAFAGSVQDGTPAPGTAAHPAVGAWRWENDRLHAGNPGDPSFAVIHADGTYVEYYPGHGVGIGAWETTGERSISLTIVFQDIDPSPTAVEPGLLTYRLAVVAEDGDRALSATGPYYVQTADGSLIEERAFDGTATRVVVADVGPIPVGTPVATP